MPPDQPSATCRRSHRVVSFEVFHCDGGHPHRQFVCRMRVGARPCGDVITRPPLGPGCYPDG